MAIDLGGEGQVERVSAFSFAPKYIALDEKSQQVYFVDAVGGELRSFDLKEKKSKLVIDGLDDPVGLAVVHGTDSELYVASAKSSEVMLIEDGETKTLTRLPKDQTPLSLGLAPTGDALLLGVAIETPRPSNSNKPPPQRLPDGIVRIDLKNKSETTLATNRVYAPSAIASDPTSGQIFWIQSASFGENMWITMNAPIDVDDPHTGRSYRLFQESYNGPWLPGSPEFEEIVPASSNKDELYMSVLSVNYDPGRGIRSAGCVLVIIGVAVMFFMRAYFFTPRHRPPTALPDRPALASKIVAAELVET